jgi:hypothetical protein
MTAHYWALLRYMRLAALSGASALLILSGIVYSDWTRDSRTLRRQALEITRTAKTQAEVVVALNHWVYGNQGFAKNHSYFWIETLGPTPIDILRSGGDCSDKSRLLSAMLFQIGIRSGLIMIYPCPDCAPIHTVVEADYEKGRMVVDPIWNIDYPTGDGRYYGVRDLAGTPRGRDWLIRLKAESPPSSKITAMPATEATFDYARGLNWNKNPIMRGGASMLRRIHVDPFLLRRPRLMEDPKLAIWTLLLVVAIALVALAGTLSLLIKKRNRSPGLQVATSGKLGDNVTELPRRINR